MSRPRQHSLGGEAYRPRASSAAAGSPADALAAAGAAASAPGGHGLVHGSPSTASGSPAFRPQPRRTLLSEQGRAQSSPLLSPSLYALGSDLDRADGRSGVPLAASPSRGGRRDAGGSGDAARATFVPPASPDLPRYRQQHLRWGDGGVFARRRGADDDLVEDIFGRDADHADGHASSAPGTSSPRVLVSHKALPAFDRMKLDCDVRHMQMTGESPPGRATPPHVHASAHVGTPETPPTPPGRGLSKRSILARTSSSPAGTSALLGVPERSPRTPPDDVGPMTPPSPPPSRLRRSSSRHSRSPSPPADTDSYITGAIGAGNNFARIVSSGASLPLRDSNSGDAYWDNDRLRSSSAPSMDMHITADADPEDQEDASSTADGDNESAVYSSDDEPLELKHPYLARGASSAEESPSESEDDDGQVGRRRTSTPPAQQPAEAALSPHSPSQVYPPVPVPRSPSPSLSPSPAPLPSGALTLRSDADFLALIQDACAHRGDRDVPLPLPPSDPVSPPTYDEIVADCTLSMTASNSHPPQLLMLRSLAHLRAGREEEAAADAAALLKDEKNAQVLQEGNQISNWALEQLEVRERESPAKSPFAPVPEDLGSGNRFEAKGRVLLNDFYSPSPPPSKPPVAPATPATPATPTGPTSGGSGITLKITHQGNKKRRTVAATTTYAQLMSTLTAYLDDAPSQVEYVDDEGDYVQLEGQDDWDEAVHFLASTGAKSLDLVLNGWRGGSQPTQPMTGIVSSPVAAKNVGSPAPSRAGVNSPRVPTLSSPTPAGNHPQSSLGFHWRRGDYIAQGATGTVYQAMNTDTGEFIAVKQFLVREIDMSAEELDAYSKEIELMSDLSHQHIVKYLGTETVDGTFNILMEYVPGGSLAAIIKQYGGLGESVLRKYTRQILLGLEYLHGHGIVHRDIKGGNILVDNAGTIKLADFGCSRRMSSDTTQSKKSIVGTPYWMAPEVIRGAGHGPKSDIWSLGATVVELATGKPPFQQYSNPYTVLYRITVDGVCPEPPESLSDNGKAFLLRCFEAEPTARASIAELLAHPWVQ